MNVPEPLTHATASLNAVLVGEKGCEPLCNGVRQFRCQQTVVMRARPWRAGGVTHAARSGLRDARVHETAAAVAERGKDLGAKGWSFIKGVYGTVASQVETVAKDSGYKLDLGEPMIRFWKEHQDPPVHTVRTG